MRCFAPLVHHLLELIVVLGDKTISFAYPLQTTIYNVYIPLLALVAGHIILIICNCSSVDWLHAQTTNELTLFLVSLTPQQQQQLQCQTAKTLTDSSSAS
jgi:hypothetical protein